MKKIIGLIAAMVLAAVMVTAATAGEDKVYICHASGQAGTLKFETLYLPPAGVAAHFENGGTPKAGHELDYFGECTEEPPPTDYCETLEGVQGPEDECPPVTELTELPVGVTFNEATCTTGPSVRFVKTATPLGQRPFYNVTPDPPYVTGVEYTFTADDFKDDR